MGRIMAPFGVKGWVKVRPYTAALDSLLDYPVWWLGGADGQAVAVLEARMHGTALIAHLQDVDDREAALALRGSEVAVEKAALPAPAAEEYYWHDLIGLAVVNQAGVSLGRVVGLLETGAKDVLVVKGERERLIPFVDDYVKVVDLAGGTITVAWQAGG